MRKRIGFTLTEVLITLGIIGIVAALTIPSLITKYQKQVTALKLKETYSIITQAAKFYTADYGIGIEGFDTQLTAKNFIERYFTPYMKIIKVCTSVNKCYPDKTPLGLDKKTKLFTSNQSSYMVTLLNGAYMTVFTTPAGTTFYIDLNGKSKPNISGRDIFFLYLINASTLGDFSNHGVCNTILNENIKSGKIKSKIYPGGYGSCYIPHATYTREKLLGTNVHRSCNPNSSYISVYGGNACAAVIMLDGWKISKDYPW